MSIGTPRMLLLLLAIVPLAVLMVRAYVKGRSEIALLGTPWPPESVAQVYLVKSFFVSIGQITFLVFAVLAAADITLGEQPIEEDRAGVDVAFALDLSRSMLAEDAPPNRLSRSIEIMEAVTRELEAARFALVGFKGRGVTIIPITEDVNAIETITSALGPELVVAPGTNVEEGIGESLRALPSSTFATRAVVLISDGEALEGETDDAISALRAEGVPLFSVTVGSAEGATIPGRDGTPVTDQTGRPVISRADPGFLRDLAERTDGASFDASDPLAGRLIAERVASLAEARESEGFRLVPRRRYRFFLGLALAGLMVSLGVRTVRWRGMF